MICRLSRKLLSSGTTFNINHERMAENVDLDILDEAGSDSDDNVSDEDIESKISPWKKSFSELKLLMEPVPYSNGLVYKRLITEGVDDIMDNQNCRIQWKYSMFMEGKEESFDTTSQTIEREAISVKGHHLALATMRKKEEAQFVIGYQLMFGELGCPPRIQPKADILFVVKLIDFVVTGDAKACDDLPQEDRRKFHVVKDKVNQMHLKATDHTRSKRYRQSVSLYQKMIQNLEFCQLANEDEQNQQQTMLFEYYSQLAECYFKLDDWKKLCLMVNELRRRNAAKLNESVNVLVNEAIAISHIEDDYKRAITMMKKVQRQYPNNERVNNELDKMFKKKEKYQQETQDIWKKAFNVKSKADNAQ